MDSLLVSEDEEDSFSRQERAKRLEDCEKLQVELEEKIKEINHELLQLTEMESALHCEILAKSNIIQHQTDEISALEEKKHHTEDALVDHTDRIQKLQAELVSLQYSHEELRHDYAHLHSLWTEKCIEDCDAAQDMQEKEEQWIEQALEKDSRIAELEAQLAEHVALSKQMNELHNSLSNAHSERDLVEKELGLCLRKNQDLRLSVTNMQTTLDDLQDDLASVRETSRLESLAREGYQDFERKLRKQQEDNHNVFEECDRLREQVEEFEDTLATSRKKFNGQVRSLEDELFAMQKETEREVTRRVEAQIEAAKEEYQQKFFQQRQQEAEEEDFDEEEYTAKVSAYLEVKIRAELTDPIREEVKEELEKAVSSRFQVVEREGLCEIHTLLSDMEEDSFISSPTFARTEGQRDDAMNPGFEKMDEIRGNLVQQCRDAILEEAQQIWADEKLGIETELAEYQARIEASEAKQKALEQKVKLFSNQLKEKNIQIYRLKWGLSSSNVNQTPKTPSQTPTSTPTSTPISTPTPVREFSRRSSFKRQDFFEDGESRRSSLGGKAPPTPLSPNSMETRAKEAAAAAAERVQAERKRKREIEKIEKQLQAEGGSFGSPSSISRSPVVNLSTPKRTKSRLSLRSREISTPDSPARVSGRKNNATEADVSVDAHQSTRTSRSLLSPLRKRGRAEHS